MGDACERRKAAAATEPSAASPPSLQTDVPILIYTKFKTYTQTVNLNAFNGNEITCRFLGAVSDSKLDYSDPLEDSHSFVAVIRNDG